MTEQNDVAKNERQRLKKLPKPLRKLETELWKFVDFMDVYDGYIGDFTGQTVPVESVNNPFVIINKMELGFPNPNGLSNEQKILYVSCIEDALNRMGFFIDDFFMHKEELSKFYNHMYQIIEKPSMQNRVNEISVEFNNVLLKIYRSNYELP